METIINNQNNITEDNNLVSQKTMELTDFYCFLIEQADWENELVINTKENYDNERWDKVVFCDTDTFYDKIGIDMWEFEKSFVSFKYIDDMENSANLIVKINGINQRFVLDVV